MADEVAERESTESSGGVDDIVGRIESALKEYRTAQAEAEKPEPGTKVPVKAQPRNLKDASAVARKVLAGKKTAGGKAGHLRGKKAEKSSQEDEKAEAEKAA